jgi:nitric-oxide synthase
VPTNERLSVAEELAFLHEVAELEETPGVAAERIATCSSAVETGQAAPLTATELTWAGRFAWRNHARCIGRLHWRSLKVRDRRNLAEAAPIFNELLEHLHLADHGGQIRSVMTVFAPHEKLNTGPRIWNHQLIAYAGYRAGDGSVLGDPKNTALTERALALGWNPPRERSAFDILPVIIAGRDGKPQLFSLPRESVREVPISHPEFGWFAELGLRWYAVPMITDMRFHAAATDFCAAPFNGWYMGTEIGARDLADETRYNQLPRIAARMGLDASRARTLWRDRALVELNVAVLHSFAAAGVKIVDHHTASDEFMRFCTREQNAGREVSARWDWIVPPLSPATTQVFHTPMHESARTPDFHVQTPIWQKL